MFWMFLLAVVLGLVFFKLGVYSVVLSLVTFVAKVLFFGSGLFLLVYAGRWILQRRRRVSAEPRGRGIEFRSGG